jgi:hypothetical protein
MDVESVAGSPTATSSYEECEVPRPAISSVDGLSAETRERYLTATARIVYSYSDDDDVPNVHGGARVVLRTNAAGAALLGDSMRSLRANGRVAIYTNKAPVQILNGLARVLHRGQYEPRGLFPLYTQFRFEKNGSDSDSDAELTCLEMTRIVLDSATATADKSVLPDDPDLPPGVVYGGTVRTVHDVFKGKHLWSNELAVLAARLALTNYWVCCAQCGIRYLQYDSDDLRCRFSDDFGLLLCAFDRFCERKT